MQLINHEMLLQIFGILCHVRADINDIGHNFPEEYTNRSIHSHAHAAPAKHFHLNLINSIPSLNLITLVNFYFRP